ncbi:DgyrCDS2507 [Dimorphilus gyrociliatus]|uniref:Serine/threonine-protein phosphatase PGAM5, mitochondrial n=1 Tax=Dimorphilus gyrociliatus TaxID=2664684 RepID=A0A7I8VAI2_9ANNE|nr:DgyrCDS2507 [Dimorphilus gyrociliatus]
MPVLKYSIFNKLGFWIAVLIVIIVIFLYKDSYENTENQSDKIVWNFNWDSKGILSKGEAKVRNVKSFVFVRHGHYNRQSGRLTKMGREQAEGAGKYLKQMRMKFKAIYSSSSIRAQETAQIIHQYLPKIPFYDDDLLKEGLPDKPSPTQGNWNFSSEVYEKHIPRFESAFKKYMHRADIGEDRNFYILVAHGNIIRYFLLKVLQLNTRAWMRLMLPHASITLIHINPDGTVTATRIGMAGFLKPDLLTWT